MPQTAAAICISKFIVFAICAAIIVAEALISWGTTIDSFVIWNETEFSTQLLPKYFKHDTFSSFIRQLNIYMAMSLSIAAALSLCYSLKCS